MKNKILVLIILLMLIPSTVSAIEKKDKPTTLKTFIVFKKMTKKDVLDLIGYPHSIHIIDERKIRIEVWFYNKSDTNPMGYRQLYFYYERVISWSFKECGGNLN